MFELKEFLKLCVEEIKVGKFVCYFGRIRFKEFVRGLGFFGRGLR